MRLTDTLVKLKNWESSARFSRYVDSRWVLSDVVGNPHDWDLLFDNHQYSTHDAGKSSCVFWFKVFADLEEALDTLILIHKTLPKVNIELQVMPDGYFDFGDGGGSYRYAQCDTYLPL